MQIRAWLGKVLEEWNDVILCNMPMFHVYGNAGAISVSIVGHNPMALVPNPRDIPDLLHTIQQTTGRLLPRRPHLV